ncbi:hypothetical protein [Dechloromonas sp. HYN0024]|jgi:hypothetical protein|uniref:hypothetical protein n=1 Tax=Dechloromonas sp. HYN0024 TaxID=2231055 RepID=UPI000E43EA00|nr:hypothetical protein [Dechloromonas sp. HYN0024]AXS78934.1 hypothetical protein HYN24_02115 [Dechloromonas sp. HYN0024]
MYRPLNAAFLELERTRDLVADSCSLAELHRVVNQLMRDALACSRAKAEISRQSFEDGIDTSLDELIETLTNICIALFDSHDIPRERILMLVDKVLAQQLPAAAYTSH